MTVMFHKVVWQHMQGLVRFLMNLFTANLPRNLPVKKIENRLRFDRIMAMSSWPHFLAHPVWIYLYGATLCTMRWYYGIIVSSTGKRGNFARIRWRINTEDSWISQCDTGQCRILCHFCGKSYKTRADSMQSCSETSYHSWFSCAMQIDAHEIKYQHSAIMRLSCITHWNYFKINLTKD